MRSILVAFAVALLVLLTACGGDDESGSDEGSGSDPTSTTADSGDDGAGESEDDGSGETDGGLSLTPGTGFIQIGELRHELTVELCANLFGGINGRAISVSDPETVQVVFNIAPEDWEGSSIFDEPGSIQYSESLAVSWTTGATRYIEDYELPAKVDPSTIAISSHDMADDGESVTGEATFYDLDALIYTTPVAPQTGSFAFACPSN